MGTPEDFTPCAAIDDGGLTPSMYMRRLSSNRQHVFPSTSASAVDSFIFCCGWRDHSAIKQRTSEQSSSSTISLVSAEAEERAVATPPARATVVEMLLRGFLDLNGDCPPSPAVSIVANSRHRNDLEFVISIVLRNQAQFEALARALRTAARLVPEQPL